MRELWSEDETLKRWLQTETAIAQSQAQLKLIPAKAARKLASITAHDINRKKLIADAQTVGRPIAGLVKQLRALAGEDCARYVHWGPSTQDILDTAMMTQARDGLALLSRQLKSTTKRAESLARKNRHTPAASRTNNQHAMPIAFGDKARGWALELRRRDELLTHAAKRGLLVQLGGPVGMLCEPPQQRAKLNHQINELWREELKTRGETRQGHPGADIYNGKGAQLKKLVAKKLGLNAGEFHWQNARDGVGEIISALSLLSSTLRRMSRNINALSSSDINEVREMAAPGKGASSSMAHKQNQRCSEFAEATSQMAMRRAEGINDSSQHEHERSGGAWICEWSTIPEVFLLTSAALHWSDKMLADIVPNKPQMKQNLRTLLRQVK